LFLVLHTTAASPIAGQALPQSSSPPQPSLIFPQLSAAHVFFVQTAQTLAAPAPPQVSPAAVQPGQVSILPQPSLIVPQLFGPQVLGTQAPQMLAAPDPPQVSPTAEQSPHASSPPQPSEILPQFFPFAAQVVGAQHLLL
jgi:hypothetical protein